jgi:hypothetical protein
MTTMAPLKAFFLDQATHVVVILVAWSVLLTASTAMPGGWLSEDYLSLYLTIAVLAAALAFNAVGGSVIVDGVLAQFALDERTEMPGGHAGAGRVIGMLERTIMLALVLYGELGAIAVLIAAKSIARFEEIKQRKSAEYYLIGTLTSLLVALAVGWLTRVALGI